MNRAIIESYLFKGLRNIIWTKNGVKRNDTQVFTISAASLTGRTKRRREQ